MILSFVRITFGCEFLELCHWVCCVSDKIIQGLAFQPNHIHPIWSIDRVVCTHPTVSSMRNKCGWSLGVMCLLQVTTQVLGIQPNHIYPIWSIHRAVCTPIFVSSVRLGINSTSWNQFVFVLIGPRLTTLMQVLGFQLYHIRSIWSIHRTVCTLHVVRTCTVIPF